MLKMIRCKVSDGQHWVPAIFHQRNKVHLETNQMKEDNFEQSISMEEFDEIADHFCEMNVQPRVSYLQLRLPRKPV